MRLTKHSKNRSLDDTVAIEHELEKLGTDISHPALSESPLKHSKMLHSRDPYFYAMRRQGVLLGN
jgi:hypothetical protein